MGTLAISSANLNTIENNMLALNNNIRSVTSDIININGQINGFNQEVGQMKASMQTLEQEIRDFMMEIRGTTLVSNAQNDILIKQNELNKKYGNYDLVRRQLNGILDSVNLNLVSKSILSVETQKVLLNAPNYYLSYALIAICAWFNNDRTKAYSALNEALKLNIEKTSLLLGLVHLKLGRNQTAMKWLKKYFELQNPMTLDSDLVSLIEGLTSNVYDDIITKLISENVFKYANSAKTDEVINNQVKRWENFFKEVKGTYENDEFPNIIRFTNNWKEIKENLGNADSYYDLYFKITNLLDNVKNVDDKEISKLISGFVFSYEDEELKLKKSILQDDLIIKYRGNTKKADEEYLNSSLSLEGKCDFYTMLSNILLERNDVSLNTKKFALAYLKDIIKTAINNVVPYSDNIMPASVITINDWSGATTNGSNETELKEHMHQYLWAPFQKNINENSFLNIKIIFSAVGTIVGAILAIAYNIWLGFGLIFVSLILIFFFASDILKKRETIKNEYLEIEKKYDLALENILAEIVDAHFVIKRAKDNYDYILEYLNSFNEQNYMGRGV